ncbi:PadR family transcriptional regulator [Scopulibacillus cellulosilyticus]|uniref:PadR family transcriptional regulator n=1 Tax=Scopulibacillus cellulosilyticus TaxID=2665665 RepID=A0ABW2PSA4_9BACL
MSLRYALLGLLMKHDATGYELMQEFKEKIIYFWHAHHTQIYRELSKMENEGLVKSRVVHQADHPDKKIYHIQQAGKDVVYDWLNEQAAEPAKLKDFRLLKVALFDFIETERAIDFLKSCQERHKNALDIMQNIQKEKIGEITNEKENLGEYLTSEFGIRYMKLWIDWCNWAIDTLKRRGMGHEH